nr:cilia- and flagella-associated protein 43-like [Nomia melanderi]
MRYSSAETSWAKFGEARDFAFVGRDAIAIVSGVYARFFDWSSGETRIERFEGRERGDGASRVAGLSVAPIFSLVERKSNPLISVFVYPSLRRIARCAESNAATGYSCCAFAGTEYLLGQTIHPDFRIILWHWRTGERLTETDATVMDPSVEFRATLTCTPDSPLLVARKSTGSTSNVSIYRVLICSKIVRLFPIETRSISDRDPVAVSWTTDGTLLLCDRFGNVECVEIDEDEAGRVRTIVRSSRKPRRDPVLVAHRDGALLVVASGESAGNSEDIRATFFRRGPTDGGDWRTVWTMPLPSYPRRAESHPRDDKIVLLDERGGTLVIVGPSRDRAPRVETLVKDDEGFEAIAALPAPHVAALSRKCRLLILDAATGAIVSATNASLSHHGKVTRFVSHPSRPLLATSSDTGNCLLVETSTPSSPRILCCAHLQRESLDTLKFSDNGGLLGVGSSQLGRLFLLGPTSANVAIALNVGRPVIASMHVVDFLIYESKSRSEATAVVLAAGREIATFSCRLNGDYRETAVPDHVITLPLLYESLFAAGKSILAVPRLSKVLHRIELESEFREATLCDVVSSLHRARNIEVGLHRSGNCLLSCGYDGTVVVRDVADLRRVWAIFAAHHGSEGGTRAAVLVGDEVICLGRNGDLTASRIIELEGKPSRIEKFESLEDSRWISDAKTEADDWQSETWIDGKIRERNAAEQKRDLSARLSILEDFEGLKRRIAALLDSNEAEPPEARLPIRAFDLDQEARSRKLAAVKSEEERLSRACEQRIDRYDRASRFLRERFLDNLLVAPSSVSSVFSEAKVANYPLQRVSPQDEDLLSWCRFSEKIEETIVRFEEESLEPTEVHVERNRFASRHGYVQVWEASVLAADRERDAKYGTSPPSAQIRFNRLFEEIRSAKEKEADAATELAAETRRCVDELMRTFRVDATDKLLDASRWRTENRRSDGGRVEAEVETRPKTPSEDDAFRRSMLERTMDGVLEVGLEENAKRSIPVPDCLIRGEPAGGYTREDAEAVAAYEEKMRALRADRRAYRSTLEEKIERAREEFRIRAESFDSRLKDLATEKIRVERSVLFDRFVGAWTILWHRRVARRRSEIRSAVELQVTPAARRVRALAAECEQFEAGLAELRNRYESLRKRDKLLEEKFRADLLESKQPMAAELLLRHYRKRPKPVSAAACGTSPAFLRELAERVLDRGESDLLPRDWFGYLRGVRDLDAMPDSPPFRIEADQWRDACALRRLKIEAEIKVRSCAVELAEAEQSVAFCRRTCSNARAAASRRKETVQRLEKALLELLDDREVPLLLRTGQLRQQPSGGSTSDWAEALLIPRRELRRVTEAIAATGRRKLTELRRLVNLRRTASREEWRLACLQRAAEDLRARARDLANVKSSKIVQLCARSELPESKIERSLQARRSHLERTARRERARLTRVASETRTWRRRNSEMNLRIDRERAEIDELATAARDPLRSRAAAFRKRRVRAIRRKASLARAVREHFEELLLLESRLEISKLRTYPTLTTRLKI